jgi:hypothetical protein
VRLPCCEQSCRYVQVSNSTWIQRWQAAGLQHCTQLMLLRSALPDSATML